MGHTSTSNENNVKDRPNYIEDVAAVFDEQISKLNTVQFQFGAMVSGAKHAAPNLIPYYREESVLLARIITNSRALFEKGLSDPKKLQELINALTALNAYLESASQLSTKKVLCQVGWFSPSAQAGGAILAIGLLVAIVALITCVSPYFALLLVPVVCELLLSKGPIELKEYYGLKSDIRQLVEHHNPDSFQKATASHWFFSSSSETPNDKETISSEEPSPA